MRDGSRESSGAIAAYRGRGSRSLLCAFLLLLAYSSRTPADSAGAEAPILHDGDLLSTCDTRGPGPQRIAFRCGLGTGSSDRWGTMQTTAVRAEYGLLENLSAGLTATFHSEANTPSGGTELTKSGPGDARLFVRWRYPQTWSAPLTIGLRPALRIPTGYDRDAENLAPFTTRTLDLELLGLVTLETTHADLYVNPGLYLPGEDHNSELLAGLGVRFHRGLPFSLQLAGEFFNRYDLPERSFTHEIFAGLSAPLPWGILAEVAVHKQLLDHEGSLPEVTLRLGSGLWRPETPPEPESQTGSYRFALAGVSSVPLDPRGLAPATHQELVPLLLHERGLELTMAPGVDDPRLWVEILDIREGTSRSLSVPKLLATPRATLDIDARLLVTDTAGRVVFAERQVHVRITRGTGIVLVPNEGDEDTWVPTGEIREQLRLAGARTLAANVRDEIVRLVPTLRGR
jgi:hypothetical protein